jgi:Asp-tRNA(Asn)/Glu-tRNA(Gln) amidotransferase A subunit family amidase
MSSLADQPARALARDIAAGRLNAVDVCEAFLDRIHTEERVSARSTR